MDEAAGGSNNASTSGDVTDYYINIPSNAIDLALFLESDRLGYLLDVAACMLQAGIARRESRGAHSRPYDFPDRDDESFLKHSITRWNGDGPELSYGEVRMTKWEPMERTY